MGLLDKVDNLDEAQPAKAKPKAAKAVPKAKPKAAKAAAKAAPKAKTAKPAKAAKVANRHERPKKSVQQDYLKDTNWLEKCRDTLVG